jgi:predicted MFS family arabinose efflux permease
MSRFARLRSAHYAWIVFATTFLILIAASGFRSTPSVLILPLQDEFGWSRATISFAISVNLLLFGFMGPFAAALMMRFGIRRVVMIALTVIALGALATTRMTDSWQLVLLWGIVVGIGSGSMATVLGATVVSRWFVARRGVALGLLSAATATGQLVFLPLLARFADAYGWRTVSTTVALFALAVIPVVFLFMREQPADKGLAPYGATADTPLPPRPTGSPIAHAFGALRMASKSTDFWLLAITFFVCGASTNGLIGTHLIPASVDHGMAEVTAAGLLALIGIFDIIGTTGSGWLTDRWNPRKLLFMYYGLRGLSLLYLPFALQQQNAALILFIVFYGLDWVATVPPTVALTTDAFGKAQAPIVYGWIFSAHQVGSAMAAFGAGALRSTFGDYVAAFAIAGVMCLAAAYLALQIGRSRRPGAPLPEPVPVPAT